MLEFALTAGALALAFAGKHGLLEALELPEHVRHRRARQHEIVDARGARVVFVEAAQVRIDVIGAAAARDQREVRRGDAEPARRVLGTHRVLHRVERLLAGEHDVVDQLVLGELQIVASRL